MVLLLVPPGLLKRKARPVTTASVSAITPSKTLVTHLLHLTRMMTAYTLTFSITFMKWLQTSRSTPILVPATSTKSPTQTSKYQIGKKMATGWAPSFGTLITKQKKIQKDSSTLKASVSSVSKKTTTIVGALVTRLTCSVWTSTTQNLQTFPLSNWQELLN